MFTLSIQILTFVVTFFFAYCNYKKKYIDILIFGMLKIIVLSKIM